jgi:hypothetical protein
LQDATLFVYFSYTYIHSFNHIHTIHLSIAIRWGHSPSPHRLKAQWEDPPCGAEPRIELGPAFYSKPTRYQLSHAAPFYLVKLLCILRTAAERHVELMYSFLDMGRYLFPESYHVYLGTTAESRIERMGGFLYLGRNLFPENYRVYLGTTPESRVELMDVFPDRGRNVFPGKITMHI